MFILWFPLINVRIISVKNFATSSIICSVKYPNPDTAVVADSIIEESKFIVSAGVAVAAAVAVAVDFVILRSSKFMWHPIGLKWQGKFTW